MEYKKENKLEDALDVLTSSLMDLKEYWAEDNTYLTPEGPKHLDNDIYNQIREICSSIKIAVNEESLELNYLNHFNSELSLIVNYEGNYLPGIPVNYKPSNLTYGRPKTVFTAENGTALIPIETHKQYKNSFHINLWVDLESMLKNGEYPELEELLIRSINQTKLSVPVKVQLPKVYFIPKLDDENKLVHTMKNELQKNNFIVVSEPDLADVEINIESSTKNGGTAQGFKVAMLDFSIAMQNHDNQTILYSDSFTNIKGLHINYAGAIGEAYNNGANKIRKEVVPRILEVML